MLITAVMQSQWKPLLSLLKYSTGGMTPQSCTNLELGDCIDQLLYVGHLKMGIALDEGILFS